MSLAAKINLIPIVKAHVATLVDASKPGDRVFKVDLGLFFGIPILAAFLSFVVIPGEALIGALITSLSVFAALLFNLLMLVLSVIEKRKGNRDFILLQRETYANIAYAILVSLVAVALLLIPYFYQFTADPAEPSTNGQKIFWGAVYFLLANFGLTMAMILKRMHSILVHLIEIDS